MCLLMSSLNKAEEGTHHAAAVQMSWFCCKSAVPPPFPSERRWYKDLLQTDTGYYSKSSSSNSSRSRDISLEQV